MSDSEHDDDFEAYLKRRVPIDQSLKSVDRLEPPQELDRVIIGKARNAIQNSPPVPLYRAPKWALPVGLAATLLIAFSIVWDLGVRSGRHQQAVVSAAPAVTNSPAPMATAPALANGATPVPAASEPAAPSAAVSSGSVVAKADPAAAALASSKAETSAKTFAHMQPPPIKTAPWPPIRRSAAKPSSSADAVSGGISAAATESLADLDLRSRSAERRVAEKRLRSDESDRVAVDVGSATALAQNAVPAPAAPPPRPLVDATANAGAPTPMRLAAATPKVSAVTFDGTKVVEPRSTDRFDASAAGPVARAAVPAAANPSAEAVTATDRREHPDPKAWLDQIQKLRVTGPAIRAEQEMKHFRDAYPTWPATSPDGGTQ